MIFMESMFRGQVTINLFAVLHLENPYIMLYLLLSKGYQPQAEDR